MKFNQIKVVIMLKNSIPLAILTLALVFVDIYGVFLSVHFYQVARSIDVKVININLSLQETNLNVEIKLVIKNPTRFDLTLEYLSVRPYVDGRPLTDPKASPPFLGRNYFQGDRSSLPKLSNRTVTIRFDVPANVLPANTENSWTVVITVILRGVPLVDRVLIRRHSSAVAHFLEGSL